MNRTRESTPPNPTPDLPIRSTDLNKTLGIVGTPRGHSIAKLWSTKTHWIKRNRRNPAKNSSNPRTPKTPKSSPFAHGFERRIQGKRTTMGSCIHPPPNPKEKGLEIALRKTPRLRKSPKRTNGNNTSKPWGTTMNHLYITKRFIQACRPIIHPSHKISPWSSQASPIEILGKIGRENRKTKWARVPGVGCHPLTSWVIWRQAERLKYT
jgi:hypothetical protein